MFRLKLIVVLLVGVALAAGVLAVYVPSQVEDALREELVRDAATAASSLERLERLNDFSLVEKAKRIAGFDGLQSALVQEYEDPYEHSRHLGVYNKGLLRWQYAFENLKKTRVDERAVDAALHERPPYVPDLAIVTDDKGIGVAALGKGRYDWFKSPVATKHPAVMSVGDGTSRNDLWNWSWTEGDSASPYRVGIAPVMQGPDKMVGVVVVGSRISDASASVARQAIGGQDVAYFYNGRVVASTLKRDEDLTAAILGESAREGREPAVFSTMIGEDEYLVGLRHFGTGADAKGPDAGMMVMIPVAQHMQVVGTIQKAILLVGLLLMLGLMIGIMLVVRSFVKPLEDLDQGIQEIIAGNKDYVFSNTADSGLAGSLGQALNLMSAFLQGKRMPDEDEEGEDWGNFLVGQVTQTAIMRAQDGSKPPVAAAQNASPATAEPVEEYQKRIFKEYTAARKNLGQEVSGLTLESFLSKLGQNAEALRKKHGAREIRFSVVIHEGKVVLKPQPIF